MPSALAFSRGVVVLSVAIFVFHSGCHHQPRSMPASGSASFVFIAPLDLPLHREVPRPAGQGEEAVVREDVFVDAEPLLPLAVPVYPPAALQAKAGWMTVAVRLTVDINGRVSGVAPSPVGFSTPSPFSDLFFAAVEQAVRQWKFVPARIHSGEPGGETRKIEATGDVSFTFTSTGDVLPGTADQDQRR